ncbi:hypothetical protein D6C87_03799 [Aureobasidium pullulans]|nr:hypothetical protein D6C87_03799 [Aureobasidium pullulans]
MASQIADDLGAQTLVGSVVTMFTDVFAGSSTLFITLGLLVFITRILVRLGTSNCWGALCYATDDASELLTAPSCY